MVQLAFRNAHNLLIRSFNSSVMPQSLEQSVYWSHLMVYESKCAQKNFYKWVGCKTESSMW